MAALKQWWWVSRKAFMEGQLLILIIVFCFDLLFLCFKLADIKLKK